MGKWCVVWICSGLKKISISSKFANLISCEALYFDAPIAFVRFIDYIFNRENTRVAYELLSRKSKLNHLNNEPFEITFLVSYNCLSYSGTDSLISRWVPCDASPEDIVL